MENVKYILIDMYGVIIKESKGYFIPYTYEHFGQNEYARITKIFREDKMFSKAQLGEISSQEFLTAIGYPDPESSMKDYLEKYLTLDEGFRNFGELVSEKYKLVLLSNDVAEWSTYLTGFHNIDCFFYEKIVSGNIGMRKPDPEMFKLALLRLGCRPEECLFIDNSVNNLETAEELGIKTVLFNRDDVEYSGMIVNSFSELGELVAQRIRNEITGNH